jgi:hypothetical protein
LKVKATITDTRPATVTTAPKDNVLININSGGDVQAVIQTQLQQLGIDIIPVANATYGFGNSSLVFTDLYLTSNGTVYFGNNKITYANNVVSIEGLSQRLIDMSDVASSGLANGTVLYYDGTSFGFSPINDDIELSSSKLLADILTVDGAGSGLDSDLVDGEHGVYYLQGWNFNWNANTNISGNSFSMYDQTTSNTIATMVSKEIYQSHEGTFIADSWSTTTRTAKYIITISDNSVANSDFYAAELLITHNGTTANYVTYGEVVSGNSENIYPDYSTDVLAGSVRLHITTGANDQKVCLTRSDIHHVS